METVEIFLRWVKERVLLLSSDEYWKVTLGQMALLKRQMKTIEFIHARGSMKRAGI